MLRILTCPLIASSSIAFAQDEKKSKAAVDQPFSWVSPTQSAAWAKKALPATVQHATFWSASMGVDVGYY